MPPRSKKGQDTTSRKKKKEIEEEVEDIINDDDEEEDETPKKSKKETSKSSKSKKSKKADEDEDELSELEGVDDEELPVESNENDEVATSQRSEKRPVKIIDPKTPIGSLKTDDILSYLIQVGTDTLNPQLKYGALNLLQQLTGRRRRPMYGSKSNRGFPRGGGGFQQRGGRPNGGRGMMQRSHPRQQTGMSNSAEPLYNDDE